jgi:hypothetical protein
MIKILGTNENSIKFSDTVKRLFRTAYVINTGHDAEQISGRIKIPIPHIPDHHTTTPLFGRECMVMVF